MTIPTRDVVEELRAQGWDVITLEESKRNARLSAAWWAMKRFVDFNRDHLRTMALFADVERHMNAVETERRKDAVG